MRLLFLVFTIFFVCSSFDPTVLNKVRLNYDIFLSDKELCQSTIMELDKNKNVSALYLAYLGALQAINANHVFNPINKLQTFNKGKKNIELAIKTDPNNLEIRFIRLSIQKNAPFFLGYKANITEDIAFIRKNQQQITSEILKKNIEQLLKD